MTSAPDATPPDKVDRDVRWAVLVSSLPEPRQTRIRSFLDFIEAPADLRGIALVAPLMAEVVKTLSRSTDSGEAALAQAWGSEVRHVAQAVMESHLSIPLAQSRRLRTLCESNPAYAAALCAASVGAASTVRIHVFAYFLHALLRDAQKISRGQRRQVGRAFRYLAAHPVGLEIMKRLTSDTGSTAELASELDRAYQARPKESQTCKHYVELLTKLLRGGLHRGGARDRRRGLGGGIGIHGESPRMPVVEQAVLELADIEAGKESPTVRLLVEEEGAEQLREGLRSGLARDELTRPVFAEVPASDGNGMPLARDAVSRILRVQDMSDHIAVHNGQFSWQWMQLSGLEVFLVHESALMLVYTSSLDNKSDHDALQTAALVLTMMYLRLTPEEAVTLRWVSRRAVCDSNHIAVWREQGRWTGVFYRTALSPSQDDARNRAEAAVLLNVVEHFTLPVPGWLAEIYGRWFTASSGRTRGLVFPTESHHARNLFRAFCERVRERHRGLRITEGRITQYCFQRAIQDAQIDNVEASQIFSTHSHLTETQLHYTACAVHALARKYSSLCNGIADEIRQEARARSSKIVLDVLRPNSPQHALPIGGLGEREIYVGSRLVPLASKVKESVSRLQQKLHEARRGAGEKGWLVRFHNAYVLYTALTLFWGSGIRTLRYPLPDPRLLDPESGRLVLSDKDDADGTRTRLVFVPEVVCTQVNAYFAHLARLPSVLFCADPVRADQLENQLRAYRDRPEPAVWGRRGRLEDRATSPFFFLDERLDPGPVGPKALFREFGGIYPFEPNAHRHYLRTHLVAAGLVGHLINAFLGHAAHGREAFTSSSSLWVPGYAAELRKAIGRILDDLGWTVMEGLT